ncbi:MAG: O-antigen ligase family protein [Anaerolineae bacterium]|nr:O-antigen ligase family protein [Anaerolineae bacterium]
MEPLILGVVAGAFWFDNPARVNFLPLLLIPLIARVILYRRLWVNIALNPLLYLFVIVCIVNTAVAMQDPAAPPYSWGWYVVGRPIMGVVLALSLASLISEHGRIQGALLAALGLAALVGFLGLTAAQYVPEKSSQLQFLIQSIPQVRGFPGAEGGFNVNEVGGAMAFFAPLAAGIVFYDLRAPRAAPLRLSIASAAFVMLVLALVLGQSRLAIIGVVCALGLLAALVIRNWRWRLITFALLLVFCVVEVGIVLGVFASSSPQSELTERDEASFVQRPVIWGAALAIIRDYPLTGVGINQFRARQVREDYPVPDFAMNVVPHAHNELLQVGADTGIPGMILFVGWHIVLGVIIWRAWRDGDPLVRVVALSAGAGLLAHTVFGAADAITLFDRFTWAYWLLVGLAGGAYALSRQGKTASANAPAAGQ